MKAGEAIENGVMVLPESARTVFVKGGMAITYKPSRKAHKSPWLTINRDTDLRIVGLARYGISNESFSDADWYRFRVTQKRLQQGRALPTAFLMPQTVWR